MSRPDIAAFFDFDFTLATTTECVRLWSPRGTRAENGRKYIPIDPVEYNVLQRATDETIDDSSFSEFGKVNLKGAKPIVQSLEYMKYYLTDPVNVVGVVSARPQKAEQYVFEFLANNGINYENRICFKGNQSSLPSLKYDHVQEKIKKYNPKRVVYFDDSRDVIEYFLLNFRKDNAQNISFTSCLLKHVSSSEKTLIFKDV